MQSLMWHYTPLSCLPTSFLQSAKTVLVAGEKWRILPVWSCQYWGGGLKEFTTVPIWSTPTYILLLTCVFICHPKFGVWNRRLSTSLHNSAFSLRWPFTISKVLTVCLQYAPYEAMEKKIHYFVHTISQILWHRSVYCCSKSWLQRSWNMILPLSHLSRAEKEELYVVAFNQIKGECFDLYHQKRWQDEWLFKGIHPILLS